MLAGRDAAEPDQHGEGQRAGNRRSAPPPEWEQQRETDERKAERRMTRHKGAVVRALLSRQWRRRELTSAAEFHDLVWPGSAPMILQHGIRDQAWAQRDAGDQKQQRLAVEPP